MERNRPAGSQDAPPHGFRLHLVDVIPALVSAWRDAFAAFPEVRVAQGNIIGHVRGSALVSPANSLGFMDGGIDRVYTEYFGPQLEQRVQAAIARRPDGLLPVGASLVVGTGDERHPYLIVAPTMEMPERVPPMNAYRAMRAMLRVAWEHREKLLDVCCPGLCTGVGGVPPEMAAREMASAYADWQEAK